MGGVKYQVILQQKIYVRKGMRDTSMAASLQGDKCVIPKVCKQTWRSILSFSVFSPPRF